MAPELRQFLNRCINLACILQGLIRHRRRMAQNILMPPDFQAIKKSRLLGNIK
jgi:hypothetical protein